MNDTRITTSRANHCIICGRDISAGTIAYWNKYKGMRCYPKCQTSNSGKRY